MPHEELLFGEFLAERMREKGLTLKRLSEATGVAPRHLENMLHGNFEHMPATPYFRGYIMRLARVLDFDGVEWWEQLKNQTSLKNSGPLDALPRNRFTKKELSKTRIGIIAGSIVVAIYLAVTFPRIVGKPTLTVTHPPSNPYVTTSGTITITGTVKNADSLYLIGAGGEQEEILIASDGSWEKTVLLSLASPNSFTITAKKFLGKETSITEQILYQSSSASSTGASSSQQFPVINPHTETPATGTFFD